MLYLGLDLGTTNVKALLVNLAGDVVSEASAAVMRYDTPDGGVEQDINQIWDATCEAVKKAVCGFDTAAIDAVGVSSQGGAVQFIDENNEPIGRVISWLDTRGAEYDQHITAELGANYFRENIGHGGSIIGPGQILRFRAESAEGSSATFFKNKKVAFVGDLIVKKLTGRAGHDATSLSICCLLNPKSQRADTRLLDRLGLNEAQLPQLYKADCPVGQVNEFSSTLTGLKQGTPVGPAIHDQYAAAVGAGAIRSGDICLATGTAWVLLAITDKFAPPVVDAAFSCPHPYNGLFGQMLPFGTGGSEIQKAMQQAGYNEFNVELVDSLLEKSMNEPGSDNTADLLYKVFADLAEITAEKFELLRNVGIAPERIILTGPAAASRFTPQIIEKITGLKVECFHQASASAYGAAMLAKHLLKNTAEDFVEKLESK